MMDIVTGVTQGDLIALILPTIFLSKKENVFGISTIALAL